MTFAFANSPKTSQLILFDVRSAPGQEKSIEPRGRVPVPARGFVDATSVLGGEAGRPWFGWLRRTGKGGVTIFDVRPIRFT